MVSSMPRSVAVIGGGPAGLAAAEQLAGAGHRVIVLERMPTPARKLLMAGRGGLNITHGEPLEAFLGRYPEGRLLVEPSIRAFPPDALVDWCRGLGQETFKGSSGRVFPRAMKASPLLRAWLARLARLGVDVRARHTWVGWTEDGALAFTDAAGRHVAIRADATLLALGGASWPRLGSDGAWVPLLAARGIAVAPLRASNVGLRVAWSAHLVDRFAGTPLKRIAVSVGGVTARGEAVLTRTGLEGGAVYALSAPLRRALEASGGAPVRLSIDLRPDLALDDVMRRLSRPRAKQSAATFLRKTLSLSPLDIALLHEAAPGSALPHAGGSDPAAATPPGARLPASPAALAGLVKGLPVLVGGLAGLDRAISTSGGIRSDALDERLMLRDLPGVFAAGEMLDWDAPTGGYLLQATLSTARTAANGIVEWLAVADRPAAAPSDNGSRLELVSGEGIEPSTT